MTAVRVREGDCLEVMRQMAVEGVRVDALVSDTPYHLKSIVARFGKTSLDDDTQTSQRARDKSDPSARLTRGFMGQSWDGGDVSQRVEVWRAAYRLLKPGGWLLAMSATRTQHRMVCAIEDAGFEVRDLIGWMYAQGFAPNKPARDGEGVRLKPAWEPISVSRKPLGEPTVQANLDRYGVGALRVQDCRVEGGNRTVAFNRLPAGQGRRIWGEDDANERRGTQAAPKDYEGRFPANLILDGSDEVRALFPDSAGQQGDVRGTEPPMRNKVYGEFKSRPAAPKREEDDLSAARFFYCAKATKEERAFDHPTVKPLALMRYLVKLVTPPGGLVLDPFAGTGQTGAAAALEGRRAILIEKEAEYAAKLRERFPSGLGGGSERPRRRLDVLRA